MPKQIRVSGNPDSGKFPTQTNTNFLRASDGGRGTARTFGKANDLQKLPTCLT